MSTKKIESKNFDKHFFARFPLDAFDAFFQRLRRLFVLAFDNTTDNDNNAFNDTVFKNNHRKYFLPK